MNAELVLRPRAWHAGALRVWVCAPNAVAAPALAWSLDDAPFEPRAILPMQSARSPDLLPAAPRARAFVGLYELSVEPGAACTVSVRSGAGRAASLRTRALPTALEHGAERAFCVLLTSCFHHTQTPAGALERVLADIRRVHAPQLTVLMGDQVYLDLPTLADFPSDAESLAAKFERDYVHNFCRDPGFGAVLDTAPSVALPDDHEFWNNYPHPSVVVGNVLRGEGRAAWTSAALRLYRMFQEPAPTAADAPLELDVAPLSFFFADARSARDPNRAHTLTPGALAKLRAWTTRVREQNLFGIFVSGQSLFRAPDEGSSLADWEHPNYRDHAEILRALAETSRDLLCLTGDVHFSRIVRARDPQRPGRAVYEVICSPSALVETIGGDQVRRLWNGVQDLFGPPRPWPRHGCPKPPPVHWGQDVLGKRFACETLYPLGGDEGMGDRVAVLSFEWRASKLSAYVTYWPIHPTQRDPIRVSLFTTTCPP